MSILDIDNINCDAVYKDLMLRIQNVLYDFGCRILLDPNPGYQEYYTDIYRTDVFINVAPQPSWDSNAVNYTTNLTADVLHSDCPPSFSVKNESYLCLVPKYYQDTFAFLRMYVENDNIILEPAHQCFPILVKDMQSPPPICNSYKFRIPKDYKGYIKCVDSDTISVSEAFPGCMIISEKSIKQSVTV